MEKVVMMMRRAAHRLPSVKKKIKLRSTTEQGWKWPPLNRLSGAWDRGPWMELLVGG